MFSGIFLFLQNDVDNINQKIPSVTLTTDKYEYEIGENVQVTFKNIGNVDVKFHQLHKIEILDEEGKIVGGIILNS